MSYDDPNYVPFDQAPPEESAPEADVIDPTEGMSDPAGEDAVDTASENVEDAAVQAEDPPVDNAADAASVSSLEADDSQDVVPAADDSEAAEALSGPVSDDQNAAGLPDNANLVNPAPGEAPGDPVGAAHIAGEDLADGDISARERRKEEGPAATINGVPAEPREHRSTEAGGSGPVHPASLTEDIYDTSGRPELRDDKADLKAEIKQELKAELLDQLVTEELLVEETEAQLQSE